jgi:hypothetical protein
MKTSNYIIIGAIIIGAYFLLRKKPLIDTPEKPLVSPNTPDLNIPISVYPVGVTEGMRVVGGNGDGTQYLIQQGKKYGITLEQWIARGYDPYIVIDQRIIDLIPSGGTLNNGAL